MAWAKWDARKKLVLIRVAFNLSANAFVAFDAEPLAMRGIVPEAEANPQ